MGAKESTEKAKCMHEEPDRGGGVEERGVEERGVEERGVEEVAWRREAWRREAWRRECPTIFLLKNKRGPPSVRTLELFQRQRWGNV